MNDLFGGSDETAPHNLAAARRDNAMDGAVTGHANLIEAAPKPGSTLAVRDNPRRIPVDLHPRFEPPRERCATMACRLFVEEIRMSAGSSELKLATVDAIKQQPIRLDMQVVKAFPLTLERMITIGGRQRLLLDQQRPHGLQFVHILAALPSAPHVAFEPARPYGREHVTCRGP